MLLFGAAGFAMAYQGDADALEFSYVHGGIAIFVYLIFYLCIFGFEQIKWMVINAMLGLYGISVEINWILNAAFDKSVNDFSYHHHIMPFIYYVLYTFLLRQGLLDMFKAHLSETRRQIVNTVYVAVSLLIYSILYWVLN